MVDLAEAFRDFMDNYSFDDELDINKFVSSSAITHLAYDEDTEELYVTYIGGRTYTYFDVPKSKAKYFVDTAPSKGKYVNYRVKPNYAYAEGGP